jgi:hypothetical protein
VNAVAFFSTANYGFGFGAAASFPTANEMSLRTA